VRAIDAVTLCAISRWGFMTRKLALRNHVAVDAQETLLVHAAAMVTTLEKVASVRSELAS
jgi:hypothetical protein